MKTFRKVSLSVTVIFLFLATIFTTGNELSVNADSLGIETEAAIIVDANSGQILYEKNAESILGVASMSKMMTEYLVLEAIKDGKISWDQEVIINEYIHKLSAAPGLSNIGLTQGEAYTVKELYEAMAVHSGNAATVALAELIAGTEKKFVSLMNEKAQDLNLQDYKFVNSTGLNNSSMMGQHPVGEADEENLMSARSTALLAYHLLKDFPEVLETAQIARLKFRDGREYPNFNWMLPSLIFEYKGVDGLKTGSTNFAGFAFTATAERNGQRFITVVMKAENAEKRFAETKKLLDYAFANFSTEEIIPENFVIKGSEKLPVVKGKQKEVNIATNKGITLLIDGDPEEDFTYDFVIDKDKLTSKGELTAPLKKGEKIGQLEIKHKDNDEKINFLTKSGAAATTVDVVIMEDVEKANWFILILKGIGGFFTDLWGNITSTIKGFF